MHVIVVELFVNWCMIGRLKLVRSDGECQMDGTGKPYEEASTMVSASAVDLPMSYIVTCFGPLGFVVTNIECFNSCSRIV